jgi:predicted transposase YdaD
MDRVFDPALKTLAELSPADWLPLARRRRRRITIVDSDIGTIVSGAADKLMRVHDEPEYLLHLDFESGHFHEDLPLRLRLYNSVFEYRHRCVVLSVPVLLRPEADSPQWDGFLKRGLPGEEPLSTLRYEPIRIWRVPPEQLLSGGIGTLALAPISNVTRGQVRGIIGRMKQRLSGANPPRRAADVWAASFVLLGLRYSDEFAADLFEEVLGMEESTTYQAIVRRGRVEGERRLLLLQGESKFGPADDAVRSALESISDLAQLEALGVRLVHVSSWQELLPPQPPRRRNARRRSGD